MSQVVVSPGSVTFTCAAEGLPRPSIMWFIIPEEGPQQDLPADGFTVESVGDRQVRSNLTIENTQPLLAGMYVCNATNEVAVEIAMASLTVNSESTSTHTAQPWSVLAPLSLFPLQLSP